MAGEPVMVRAAATARSVEDPVGIDGDLSWSTRVCQRSVFLNTDVLQAHLLEGHSIVGNTRMARVFVGLFYREIKA
jgi:hypothetical protein